MNLVILWFLWSKLFDEGKQQQKIPLIELQSKPVFFCFAEPL